MKRGDRDPATSSEDGEHRGRDAEVGEGRDDEPGHRHRRHGGPDRGRRHDDRPQAQPEGSRGACRDRRSTAARRDPWTGSRVPIEGPWSVEPGDVGLQGSEGEPGVLLVEAVLDQDESDRGEQEHQDDRQALGRSRGRIGDSGAAVRAAPRPDGSRARSRCRANRPTRSRARSVALPPIQARSSRERRPGHGRIRPGDRGRSRCHRPRFLHRRFPSATVPAAASTAGGRVVLTAAEQLVHRVRGLFGDPDIDRVSHGVDRVLDHVVHSIDDIAGDARDIERKTLVGASWSGREDRRTARPAATITRVHRVLIRHPPRGWGSMKQTLLGTSARDPQNLKPRDPTIRPARTARTEGMTRRRAGPCTRSTPRRRISSRCVSDVIPAAITLAPTCTAQATTAATTEWLGKLGSTMGVRVVSRRTKSGRSDVRWPSPSKPVPAWVADTRTPFASKRLEGLGESHVADRHLAVPDGRGESQHEPFGDRLLDASTEPGFGRGGRTQFALQEDLLGQLPQRPPRLTERGELQVRQEVDRLSVGAPGVVGAMWQGRQPRLDLQPRDPSGADVDDGRELAGDGTIDDGACHLDAPVVA